MKECETIAIRMMQQDKTLIHSNVKPEQIVNDLNPTKYREAGEETHCASNQAQCCFGCHLASS